MLIGNDRTDRCCSCHAVVHSNLNQEVTNLQLCAGRKQPYLIFYTEGNKGCFLPLYRIDFCPF